MKHTKHDRRQFLHKAFRLTAGSVALPLAGAAYAAYPQKSVQSATTTLVAAGEQRVLAFNHTHTRERIDLTYAVNDQYVPDALKTLNRFLRDHYSGTVGQMDPQLDRKSVV